METAEQREQRISGLEQRRAARAAGVWPTPDDAGLGSGPVEIAPGRGDLSRTSSGTGTFWSTPTALRLVDRRPVSFARLFQSQPWIAAAVMRMLTWSIRVPLCAYRMVDSDDPNAAVKLRPGDHPLADAIQTPWEGGNAAQLTMSLLGPVLVNGNSVTPFENGAGNRITMMPKDWRFSVPIMPWRDSLQGFIFDYDIPEVKQTYSIDKVLHIAWWSPTGPIGTSPLQQLGVTLNIEDAIQRYQIASMRNGARPPAAITATDGFLGVEKAERAQIMKNLREDVEHVYGGPDRAGIPAILPPGLDWKPVGQTSVEAEIIGQRNITREEIASVYQIMPMMLGMQSEMNYSNLQAAREMTYTDALGPPLILIEMAINAQLVRAQLREPDVFVRFDFGAVLRGDRAQEITSMREALAGGLVTPNEARADIGKPRSDVDGMDEFYLPLVNNLAPVGTPVAPIQPPSGTPQDLPGQRPPSPPSPPTNGSAKRLHWVEGGFEYSRVPVHG